MNISKFPELTATLLAKPDTNTIIKAATEAGYDSRKIQHLLASVNHPDFLIPTQPKEKQAVKTAKAATKPSKAAAKPSKAKKSK